MGLEWAVGRGYGHWLRAMMKKLLAKFTDGLTKLYKIKGFEVRGKIIRQEQKKKHLFKTRPDTQLPQSRAVGQEQ